MACGPEGPSSDPSNATGGQISLGSGGSELTASGGAQASGGVATQGTGGGLPDVSSGGSSSGGAADPGSGGAESEGSGGEAAGSGGSAGPMLPPITDYSQSGPFDTTIDTQVGPGGSYTVYRPETLGEDDFLHAPIVFGPGIGQSVSVHNVMLTNFASHGFVVVGTPVLNGGPGDAGNLEKMQAGLDWILEQNTTAGIYQGKLWVDHVISMGFSVGGTSAVQLGGDEAVATVVSIHGHRASAELRGTMLQTTGTQDTVGMPLQQQT